MSLEEVTEKYRNFDFRQKMKDDAAAPPRPNCPDCAVGLGERHYPNCDIQRCSVCGGQYMLCGCKKHDFDFATWDGYFPGVKRAAELNMDLNELYSSGEVPKIFIKPKKSKTK
jgi:hypothetical protein